MKLCFDANVLLETLLEGRLKTAAAYTALEGAGQACISPLTAHLYIYFGTKEKHVLPDLLNDLRMYKILTQDERTTRWAMDNLRGNDFEDALQVGCAVLEGCDRFVTFDARLAKNYGKFIDMQVLS